MSTIATRINLPLNDCFGSFSTEVANSAAQPTSASPRKLTSDLDEKLVAMGQQRKSPVCYSITLSASNCVEFGISMPSRLTEPSSITLQFPIDQHCQKQSRTAVNLPCVIGAALNDHLSRLQSCFAFFQNHGRVTL
jgi:hypothetical protein